jgi:hypothetical protein
MTRTKCADGARLRAAMQRTTHGTGCGGKLAGGLHNVENYSTGSHIDEKSIMRQWPFGVYIYV